ncbi:hypothetical protein PC129_g19024 [Phytophthora cactorum]|uniref:Uncharacterized protein n=1 Tax=Phytophthora cactorum TaxID=29920 RepID=A0A8T1BJH4_9STRA|nr:hypothetical protein Pcac1_g4346 [Phytophthora cactorum]KAG2808681.1 hypothetical protein PC111_g16379 [Phytophthora cactorum]KAG2845347.1 hypothetical protein PC113_g18214 [Phytophthora cactorum]KAG2889541.1 hypothetical protein PC115_g19714 [Phytophthora cactorum]KAG2892493.1 hypothetical protein PC114_g16608 [Phytophthora cactorum]
MDGRPLKRFNPLLVSLTAKPTATVRSATPIHAAELLWHLAEDSALVHDDDADDTSADSDSPLLDGYFESGGSDAVVMLTNFTLTEFHHMWSPSSQAAGRRVVVESLQLRPRTRS